MNRNRKPSESVSQYALAIRELCGDCEYSAAIQSEILCDVFVKGLNLPSVQTKLLLKDNTLTFDNAYKQAVAEELAAKCSIEFNASSSGENGTATTNQVDNVNRVQTLGRNKYSPNKGTVSSGNAINSKKSCYRCGQNHYEQKCEYINEKCHWCNKTGHIARMCRAKQKSRHKSVAHVSDGDEPDNDETLLGVYSAYADLKDISGCKGFNVKDTLDSEIVPMQLDAGAAVSIIPEGTYRSVLSKYPLQASNVTLMRRDSNCLERLHSSDIRKTTVHAANRGGMW